MNQRELEELATSKALQFKDRVEVCRILYNEKLSSYEKEVKIRNILLKGINLPRD